MRIITIVGARPQFIKSAPVTRAIAAAKDLRQIILHTGQHFDAGMSGIFFDELDIPAPDFNLGIHGGNHGEMTGRMLEGIERVLLDVCPDIVLVYGDTNSTLAGALAAAKLHIPVAHVEAGLRSFNRRMPEEINRVLADHVSDLLLAPTQTAVRNLAAEGIKGGKVRLVGDVMYDQALYLKKSAEQRSTILEKLQLLPGKFVLCTIHRAENTDNPERLRNIFSALSSLAKEIRVVVPLHPRTRIALGKAGLNHLASAPLVVTDPVGYIDMVRLESCAALIATDSGGVQKEAFFHRVPCVTFRSETEWTELVDVGWNRLADPDSATQLSEAIRCSIGIKGQEIALYGSGNAAERIVEALHPG